MVNLLFEAAKEGSNQITQSKRESLQFSGPPSIKPRRCIGVAPLKGLKDIGPCEGWRSPWLILTREVRPKDPQDFNWVFVTNIRSKNVIPLVVDSIKGFIRLVNDMPTIINNKVVGLILRLILEVMEKVGTVRSG